MAYLVNNRTLLIFTQNVRDDIAPDGVATSFLLSQEVPGGYEGNVMVVRQKYVQDQLVTGNSAITIDGSGETLQVTTDQDLAAALSIVQPGDNIVISGSSQGNNGAYPVLSVSYNGNTINIALDANLQNETGAGLTISRGFIGPWEVLDSEFDYVIGGTGIEYNKRIIFSAAPQPDDKVYVMHRGDATYNFVPSPNSVGPDQLSLNLRNFICNRYTGNGSTTAFALSQLAVNAKTLLVTVNGVHVDGSDPEQSFTGDWSLDVNGLGITFAAAPANLAKIKILHLGFSTVSRRAALSPGQPGSIPPNSITATQLAPGSVGSSELDTDSVVNSKVANDAIDGDKILLDNEEGLRAKKAVSGQQALLRLNSSDQTVLMGLAEALVEIAGAVKIRASATELSPQNTNEISLGNALKKFKDLFLEGNASINGNITDVNAINASGNISTTANLSGDVITAGTNLVTPLINGIPVGDLVPAGTIAMTGRTTAPSGWLLCQGQVVSRTTFSNLFSAIGIAYGVGDGSTTFGVPDLQQRFALGKSVSGTGSVLGSVGGNIDHAHSLPVHSHDLQNHTHSVPAHWHTVNPSIGTTLNITSSGNHATALDHDHAGFLTPSGEGLHDHNLNTGHAISISTTGAHDHSFSGGTGNAGDHNHGMSFNSTDVSNFHTHTFSGSFSGTTSTNGNHNHSIKTQTGGGSTPGAPANSNANGNVNTSTDGNHNHTFSGSVSGTTSNDGSHVHGINGTTYNNGTHSHSFSGTTSNTGNHTHTIGGRIYNYESNHQHTIDIPNFVANSASSGVHTHAASSFSGVLGRDAGNGGVEGNNAMTSGAPSINSTGAWSGTSGVANPPFQVVNYMIKV